MYPLIVDNEYLRAQNSTRYKATYRNCLLKEVFKFTLIERLLSSGVNDISVFPIGHRGELKKTELPELCQISIFSNFSVNRQFFILSRNPLSGFTHAVFESLSN